MSSTDLPPSVLGTKEHWDDVYSSELANFEEIGDEGEIWFGEDSVEKMVEWALEHVPPLAPHAGTGSCGPPYVLEVGTGNGNLLFMLHDAGYPPDCLCGVDYSVDAVRLAQAIGRARRTARDEERNDSAGADTLGEEAILFCACDFLREEVPLLRGMEDSQNDVWNLVLDKGTFDAMALAERSADGAAPADAYPGRIARVVKPGGYFLITSCNFTEEELRAKFANAETGLAYHSRIPFPTFSFGGKSGNVYSSVAFHKNA